MLERGGDQAAASAWQRPRGGGAWGGIVLLTEKNALGILKNFHCFFSISRPH